MPEIKAYANRFGYSDIEPYEVIEAISEKTAVVRRMRYEKDPSWVPHFIPGGFAGHCDNQSSQKWIITSDEGSQVLKIRKHKNGQWKDSHGQRYVMSDEPRRFYDYNF